MDGTSNNSSAFSGPQPPPYTKKAPEPPPFTPKAAHVSGCPLCERDAASLQQRLGEAGWRLLEDSLRTTDFSWFVEMTGAWPRAGKPFVGGLLLATRDGRVVYFRNKAEGGLSVFADFKSVCAVASTADCAFSADEAGDGYELLVRFPESCSIESSNLVLDKRGVTFSGGGWFDVWRGSCAKRLGVPENCVCLGEVRVLEPMLDDFGTREVHGHRATVLALKDSSVMSEPPVDMGIASAGAWWSGGKRAEIMAGGGVRRCVELVFSGGARPASDLSRLTRLLPSDRRSPEPLAGQFERFGYFRFGTRHGEGDRRLLERAEDAVIEHGAPLRTFHFGAGLGETVVLVADDGECAAVDVQGHGREVILRSVKAVGDLPPLSGKDGAWTVAIRDGAARTPVRVVVSADALEIGGVATVAYSGAGEASVGRAPKPGLHALTLNWRDGEAELGERLLVAEATAYRIWEEWEVGRTRHKAAGMGFPDLYRAYNADRRHEFLLAMYGDMLLLDRTLQSGVSMPALMKRLSEQGAVKFAEDKDLRDQTVTKTVVMLEAINQMRQKAEIFASLYPYYWVRTETEWLSEAFGAEAAKAHIAAERRRLVPLVRRQIRSVQSEIMRPLLQIEAAARPVEALLGREEIRRHWSTKTRTLLPGAVQAGIGIAMMLLPGGAAGFTLVASAIGMQGLGVILDRFQRDREGAAQIMRAAESIFPWWEVLMQTMPVSIYESGQFMDDECVRSMKRDRAVAESLGAERCKDAKIRLRGKLVSAVLVNRRKGFMELAQGSGVRVSDLMDDIRKATALTFRRSVDAFVSEMTMSPGDRR